MKTKTILNSTIEGQTKYVMEQDLELQSNVAGTMEFHAFELLSFEERWKHVRNALEQMPSDILEEILEQQ